MNTTNNHQALQDDLKAYLDNELTWWRRVQIGRHLAQCAECRTEVQDMTRISQQLQTEDTVAGGENPFDLALRSRILGDAPEADRTFETAPQPRTRAWRPRVMEWTLLGGVMSMVVFAVLSTTGKKVQTVFNVANNALTTDGNGTGYADRSEYAAPAASSARETEKSMRIVRSATPRSAGAPFLGGNWVPPDTTRRVHKEASIGVAVKNAEVASDAVVKLVQSSGGFIAGNTLTSGEGDAKNAAMEIRVPVAKFDSILRQIGELGEVKSKNISGQDLTERFSNADQARRILVEDLSTKEAQLRAAQARAARKKKTYVPGWEERAELRNLRIQAAQAKARVELMRKTTDLSDISVQLQEKPTPPGEVGFWQSLNDTKLDAAKSFTSAARIPIACLIWILAYSPLWLPALLAWRYFNKPPRDTA